MLSLERIARLPGCSIDRSNAPTMPLGLRFFATGRIFPSVSHHLGGILFSVFFETYLIKKKDKGGKEIKELSSGVGIHPLR